jgi:NAD(P)-dependent dehydrogenase (short-subunit alcohol dehydrogenase family)
MSAPRPSVTFDGVLDVHAGADMPGLLEDRIVLISGTGGGMGRAAALAFAAEGAKVVGCDLNVDGSRETVELVLQQGGVMTGFEPVDLTDPDAAKGWIDDGAARYGGIDVLYNNAANARFAPISELSIEDWRQTLRSELDTVFLATKFAWPHLVARGGGVIINTASVAGMLGSPSAGMAAHSAGKAGVIGFTRQTAAEGAPAGIRAVSISPGPIETPGTTAHYADDSEAQVRIANRTLLGRRGRAEEVAHLAVFLASDKAAFVTGANYVVDGGMTSF